MALIDSARRTQEECKTQGLLWQTMKQHWMTALRELAGDLRRLSRKALSPSLKRLHKFWKPTLHDSCGAVPPWEFDSSRIPAPW